MFKKLTILIFVFVLSITYALAQTATEKSTAYFSTEYSGTYIDISSDDPWNLVVSFSDLEALNSSDVELNGMEKFVNRKTQDTYGSKVRALANTKTLNVVMEEIYSGKKEEFIPMVYYGSMSPDLKEIKAKWVSKNGREVLITLRSTMR